MAPKTAHEAIADVLKTVERWEPCLIKGAPEMWSCPDGDYVLLSDVQHAFETAEEEARRDR